MDMQTLGAAIAFAKKQGGSGGTPGTSAGFGTPTASATPLTSGEQPTVNISASGPNTAKVFDFQFGIPAGADGKTPVKGVDYYTEADKEEIIEDVLANVPSSSDVVVVELPELAFENPVTVTDEQFNLLMSENKFVYIIEQNGIMLQKIAQLADNNILFSSIVPLVLGPFNIIVTNIAILDISQKQISIVPQSGWLVPTPSEGFLADNLVLTSKQGNPQWSEHIYPAPQPSDEGAFLKIVKGVPTWTALPIYNGEVE